VWRILEVGPIEKRSVLSRTAVVMTGSLLLAGLLTAPSGAATAKVKTPDSNLAVYNANVTVGSIDATVTLPSYTCKKADNIVVYENTYDNTNSGWSGPGVYLACAKHDVPTMTAFLEVDGATTFPVATLRAGDTVQFSTTCNTPGTVVALDDVTSGSSVEASSANPSSCSGGFVGDIGVLKGAGPKLTPLPAFGAIDFSGVTVNTVPLGSLSPTSTNYYEGKKNVIDVGPIGGGGTSFVTTQEP
jgi:hypothetical protein